MSHIQSSLPLPTTSLVSRRRQPSWSGRLTSCMQFSMRLSEASRSTARSTRSLIAPVRGNGPARPVSGLPSPTFTTCSQQLVRSRCSNGSPLTGHRQLECATQPAAPMCSPTPLRPVTGAFALPPAQTVTGSRSTENGDENKREDLDDAPANCCHRRPHQRGSVCTRAGAGASGATRRWPERQAPPGRSRHRGLRGCAGLSLGP
jgi:hypothetical protein